MKKLFAFMVSLFCLVTNAAAQTTKFFQSMDVLCKNVTWQSYTRLDEFIND